MALCPATKSCVSSFLTMNKLWRKRCEWKICVRLLEGWIQLARFWGPSIFHRDAMAGTAVTTNDNEVALRMGGPCKELMMEEIKSLWFYCIMEPMMESRVPHLPYTMHFRTSKIHFAKLIFLRSIADNQIQYQINSPCNFLEECHLTGTI